MSRDTVQKEQWDRFFSARNRIEVNFVREHPDYPAHDHEFVEIQLIVAGRCVQPSSSGVTHPVAGDVYLFRPGA